MRVLPLLHQHALLLLLLLLLIW